jgi:hypothetical protein
VNLPREDVSSAGREQRSGADIREDAAIALHVSVTVTCGNFSLSIAIKIASDESKRAQSAVHLSIQSGRRFEAT